MKNKPILKMGRPDWSHHHGTKARLEEIPDNGYLISIKCSAAGIGIKKYQPRLWLIDWYVMHSDGAHSDGRVILDEKAMAGAFGLDDYVDEFSQWLVDEYGVDSACQGKYIRWKKFLNIPCPGTGHDGDPNVTIDLDDEIKKAVAALLNK